MKLRLHLQAAAEADLAEAAKWYEKQQSGLGVQFLEELESLLARIIVHPDGYPVIEGPIHRARHPHFPYSVFYVSDAGRIEVIAVLHAARSPARWNSRHPRSKK